MRAVVQSWPQRVALGFVALAVLWNALRPVVDLDLWWHIRLGEQMLSTGTLVPHEVFSYTQDGAPWPWKDWGAAILFYAVWSIGGAPAIVIFKAVLFIAIAVLLWQWLARSRGVPPTLAILITALALDACSFRFNERAASISLLIIVGVVLLIERHRQGKSGLWWVVPLTILNANIHRGVLVVPVVLGAFAFVETLQWRLSGKRSPKTAIIVAIASGVACLATPFTTAIFTTTQGLMGEHTTMITEWAPVSWPLVWALTPATIGVGAAVVAGGLLQGGRRPRDLWDVVLALLAIGIGLGSMRHLPYLALLGAGPAASGLARFDKVWTGSLRHAIAASVGILAFVAQLARPVAGPALGLALAHYPSLGVDFVKEHQPQGRMFNEFGYGGFLIYHLWPEHKVYIDGRTDLVYPPEAVKLYLGALHNPKRFEEEAARWDWQWIIVDNAPPTRPGHFLDFHPKWTLVHASRRALIYVRTDGLNAELARSHGYRVLRPHDLERSVLTAISRGQGQAALAELRRMADDDPDNLYAVAALTSVMKRLQQ